AEQVSVSWSADDILNGNPREGAQSKSRLERLLDVAGTDLQILSDAANELEKRGQPHVAAFFQLPYHVHIEPAWHRVPTLTVGLYAEFRFERCVIESNESGYFRSRRNTTPEGQRIPRVTQVVAIIPVWGRRALFHYKYVYHVESNRGRNPMI